MKPIDIDEAAKRRQPPEFNPRERSGPSGRVSGSQYLDASDVIRERQRLYLRRVLRHVEDLAHDIVVAINEHAYQLTPWQQSQRSCPSCRSRNRNTARFCDHCGTNLPTVP
jgi:NADH pyrophosphatase NudC (nudix superfamily)